MSDPIESAEDFAERLGDAIDTTMCQYEIDYDVRLGIPLITARDAAMLERGKRELLAEIADETLVELRRGFDWAQSIENAVDAVIAKHDAPTKGGE